MSKKLLVCIADRLSALVAKGEVTDRYYNPGDLFDEVHILMTNDDRPDPTAVQKMVGQARLHLHNLPVPSFKRTLGWQPLLLRPWLEQGLALVHEIRPALLRAYGNSLNGYLAAQVSKRLAIPFVVSLHTHPDEEGRQRLSWRRQFKFRFAAELGRVLEGKVLCSADRVIIVYEQLWQYAFANGARQVELIYNIINPSYLRRKTDYALHRPSRVLSVGRLFSIRNPDNVIRAVAQTAAEFTIIGDGELRDYLQQVAREAEIGQRLRMVRSLPNDRLCEILPDFDVYATHCDGRGIPKAIMEPLLAGLPVIVNHRLNGTAPELQGKWVMLVDNTPEGYLGALNRLLTDHAFREALGQRGYAYAQEHFAPEKMEQRVIDLYRELVPGL